jgi:hypothetical protein
MHLWIDADRVCMRHEKGASGDHRLAFLPQDSHVSGFSRDVQKLEIRIQRQCPLS